MPTIQTKVAKIVKRTPYLGSSLLKIIKFETKRKCICDFLLVL